MGGGGGGPIENENCNSTGGEFQLFHRVYRANWVLSVFGWVWGFIRRVFAIGFMELLDAGGEVVPIENGGRGPTGSEFQLLHGAYRLLDFGRYRRARSSIWAGLPQGVYRIIERRLGSGSD